MGFNNGYHHDERTVIATIDCLARSYRFNKGNWIKFNLISQAPQNSLLSQNYLGNNQPNIDCIVSRTWPNKLSEK